MAILNISDLLLSGTMIVNAVAILNFDNVDEILPNSVTQNQVSLFTKLKLLLREIQKFNIFVAFWNILMLVLMVILFR